MDANVAATSSFLRILLRSDGVTGRRVRSDGAAAAPDPELVGRAGADARHVEAPQPPLAPFQRVRLGVPPVEAADDGDALGVGGPDGEPGALGVGVGAEDGVAVGEPAFLPALDGFGGEMGHRGGEGSGEEGRKGGKKNRIK